MSKITCAFANLALFLGFILLPLQATKAQTPTVVNGEIIISEFRLRGAQGPTDEFMEIYNNTDHDITVLDASPPPNPLLCAQIPSQCGWALVDSSQSIGGTAAFIIPNLTIIKKRQRYLVTSSNYSLNSYSVSDQSSYSYDIPITSGIALFKTADTSKFNDPNFVLDAVGYSGTESACNLPSCHAVYREGIGLPEFNCDDASQVCTDGEYSFVRRVSTITTIPQDTNNNAQDFLFVSNSGGNFNGVLSVLGAPGPENSTSPVDRTASFSAPYLDPTKSSTAEPNRTRDTTVTDANGGTNVGTLTLRRRIVNNSASAVNNVRIRIVSLSTLNSAAAINDASITAQLRLRNSADNSSVTGYTGTVRGTTLESPSVDRQGGWNSTLRINGVTSIDAGVANEVPMQFYFDVIQSGTYRFFYIIEGQ